MYLSNGTRTYSPTDLVCYLESPLLACLRRYDAEYPGKIPKNEKGAELELVARKGIDHEKRHLQALKQSGKRVTEIEDSEDREERTLNALREGHPVIYQAALRMPDFQGSADFLTRVEKGSRFGAHSYEPIDTKLSLKPKPYFIVQLCCYAEMLQSMCGLLPENIHVILGDRTTKSYRTADYFFYYQQVKEGFLDLMQLFDSDCQPEPAGNESFDVWQEYVDNWIKEKDHLIQVANIRLSQIKKMKKKGIATMRALAETKLKAIPGMDPVVFMKLKRQAALQIESEATGETLYEVIPPPEEEQLRRGLALLPPPSRGVECREAPEGLDWYQKYLWMKVAYCRENAIGVYYDDDDKVITLFQNFAPEIQVFKWPISPTL